MFSIRYFLLRRNTAHIRRTALVAALMMAFLPSLTAQNYERAVGGRIGTMIGASYKQFITSTQAIEGIIDLDIIHPNDMSLRATALYEFHRAWPNADGLSWYLAPGVTAGALISKNSSFLFAADGVAGLEYKLSEIPLCFAFDLNPKLYLIGYGYIKFSPNIGVTVRYTF
ncbi:MAG: hypothetical protein LBS12_00480 [Prevotellaceae bacterium]|jgi:hypothetical protein|nr:hypothetical protein [Prevotellaceae bacterium]